jgi:Uma2 family endonuclease
VHQRIIGRLFELIAPYVRACALGETFLSPLDVKLEPGRVLQPDLLVVPAGELRRRADTVRRLLLAVEIMSPSSARHDRVRKRPHYQRNRVPEYWIVDDRSQTIERWTPDDDRPELLAERLVWQPAGAAEPFALDMVRFFKDVAAED